jgi:uncharacterized membrane protein YecN with MAPEG domain
MFAVLNTMSAVSGSSTVGRCESKHRTFEAAEAANQRLQRAVKRANGQSSYLPTRIVEVKGSAKAGALMDAADLA